MFFFLFSLKIGTNSGKQVKQENNDDNKNNNIKIKIHLYNANHFVVGRVLGRNLVVFWSGLVAPWSEKYALKARK